MKIKIIYENYFFKSMFENEEYVFNNIKEFTLEDYYFRQLICKIYEYGNFEIDFLIDKIKHYKESKGE